jgi:acyl carrier protein
MAEVSEIESRVRYIIATNLGIKEDNVLLHSKISEDLGADSLDSSQMVMDIEKEFDIPIHDGESEKLRTLQDIIDFVVLVTEVKV